MKKISFVHVLESFIETDSSFLMTNDSQFGLAIDVIFPEVYIILISILAIVLDLCTNYNEETEFDL